MGRRRAQAHGQDRCSPPDLDHVNFSYLSRHNPTDPDADPGTEDYGPDYYALFLMKVGQEDQAPPDDEWSYLSLVIEPNGLILKKWENDTVTEYAPYAFTSAQDTWYDRWCFRGRTTSTWLSGTGYTAVRSRRSSKSPPA